MATNPTDPTFYTSTKSTDVDNKAISIIIAIITSCY